MMQSITFSDGKLDGCRYCTRAVVFGSAVWICIVGMCGGVAVSVVHVPTLCLSCLMWLGR